VALLQNHVRDVMVGRVDHETMYRPDRPIFCVHGVAATYLDLADRHAGDEHRFVMVAERRAQASSFSPPTGTPRGTALTPQRGRIIGSVLTRVRR
jgi:hypothetical protein